MSQNKQFNLKHTFRKLEDLNVIDNFLFQSMLADEQDGETFVRILLSTILGKKIPKVKIVPQKSILGTDTDKHGIRLDAYIEDISNEVNTNLADVEIIPDIYDIEPNNIYEKTSLPRRTRYYHGLIDTQLLSSGIHYDKLPNIFIIFILPYDDGAKKIFLYTKGSEGNPSQALRDMLKYIEKSTDDNVTNSDIASIQELVNKVKLKKEVGINYMKSWEVEYIARKEGFNEGHQNMQEKMNQLTLRLAHAGRMDDIVKAAGDKTYQEKLFQEFNL